MISTQSGTTVGITPIPRLTADSDARASLNYTGPQGAMSVSLTRAELLALVGEGVQAWGDLGEHSVRKPVSTAGETR
ncbi:hypothetical protein ACWIGI_28725 [Nocardia sp. NPDC055321]